MRNLIRKMKYCQHLHFHFAISDKQYKLRKYHTNIVVLREVRQQKMLKNRF